MRNTILMISLTLAGACSGIEGDWSGQMKCEDGGKWPAEFTIEMNEFGDTEFEGRMSAALTCRQDNDDDTDDIECDFLMIGTIGDVERDKEGGVILRVDSCTADGGPFGSIGVGCEDPKTTWFEDRSFSDEHKVPVGTLRIDHQTSGDILCRIELDRQ
jgi:hypothetical protein